MEKVVIVVPIYTMEINIFENTSLLQLHRVLGHYPIFYVMPEKLRLNFQDSLLHTIFFPDSYFSSREAYSQLCLCLKFYERFSEYEYMLLYQTDAFVFSDRLMEFCSLGYDYIGAPLLRTSQHWKELGVRVGNGGFSLRCVQSIIRVLERKEYILSQIGHMKEMAMKYEDLFFSYCAKVAYISFTVPSVNVAKQFSIESDVGHCYKQLEVKLPFGCHAWYKVNYPIWRNIIEKFDYNLPMDNEFIDTEKARINTIRKYLIKRMMRKDVLPRYLSFLEKLFCENGYSLWGGGRDGNECIRLLKALGKKIQSIYDGLRHGDIEEQFGIPYVEPSRDALKDKEKLIVSTLKYESKIEGLLEIWGLKRNKDYILYSHMRKKIATKYFFDLFSK